MSLKWLRKRWGPALVALGSLAVMAAMACGGSGSTATPSGGGSPTATATSSAGPTATTPPQGGNGPQGSLTRAFRVLEAVYGIGYTGPYRTSATNQIGGIEERLFVYENGDPMTPELIDTWNIAEDGSKVTLKLKENIPFLSPIGYENRNFGVLNADELAEWFNRSNATTNPESTYGDAGDFAAIFNEAKVIDEWTIEIGLVSPVYFCLPISQFGCLSADRGPGKVTHVSYRDRTGTDDLEWARAHHIGTGPYVQGNCVAGDRCTMHAVNEHWRKVGQVAQITGIQVPEANTQIAMLQNGQVDMAEVDYSLLADVVTNPNLRFLETMPGGFVTQSIMWSGNLWEETHARTGAALNPWAAPSYAQDYPWIGDPWQQSHPQNVRYTDTNNPAGMTDMEQARLVRLALSIAINRDAITGTLLSGIGLPIYSEYMGPEYPGWNPSGQSGCWDVNGNEVTCSGTSQSVPWQLPNFATAQAGDLLTQAGYPLVGGQRQGFPTLTIQAYPAEAGPVSIAATDFVISDWARLGIQAQQLEEDYGGVISPRMARREQVYPVVKNGDVHSNVYPLDWPMPPVDTSSSRPGWGAAFESPAGARWLFEILGERDRATREAMHIDWVNYSLYWQQYAGLFEVPKGLVVNNRVASWNGRQQHYSNISSNIEFIVLAN